MARSRHETAISYAAISSSSTPQHSTRPRPLKTRSCAQRGLRLLASVPSMPLVGSQQLWLRRAIPHQTLALLPPHAQSIPQDTAARSASRVAHGHAVPAACRPCVRSVDTQPRRTQRLLLDRQASAVFRITPFSAHHADSSPPPAVPDDGSRPPTASVG
jgi:hypothetical protein